MTSGEEGLCFPAGCMYAEGAVCSLMSALAVGCGVGMLLRSVYVSQWSRLQANLRCLHKTDTSLIG
jgi:hypothetical protein